MNISRRAYERTSTMPSRHEDTISGMNPGDEHELNDRQGRPPSIEQALIEYKEPPREHS